MSFNARNPSLNYPPKAPKSGLTAHQKSQTGRRIELLIIFLSLWILASALPNLRFAPGNWSFLFVERIQESISPGIQILLEIIGICFIVSLIILGVLTVVSIIKRKRRKEDDSFIYRWSPSISFSTNVVIVLLFIGLSSLIWLTWQHGEIIEHLMEPQWSGEVSKVQDQHPSISKVFTPEKKRSKISSISTSQWKVLLSFILLIILGRALWKTIKIKPLKERVEAPQVIQIVSNAVKELEKGGEPSDIVLRCYRDMCKILSKKVTMSRDLTAREFTKLLLLAGVQEQEVVKLTDLFERVRYGRQLTGPGEETEAISLLRAIEEKYGRSLNET